MFGSDDNDWSLQSMSRASSNRIDSSPGPCAARNFANSAGNNLVPFGASCGPIMYWGGWTSSREYT